VSAFALVADAVEAAAAPAAEAGVRVECQVSDEAPRVDGDADRIQQVLGNLLSNAVKITPRGGRVWVRCRARRGLASFSVGDTGPGIPREQQRRIFDPFVRGAGARYQGTGLGLSIARAIVEAHGGRLWVVSRPGKGATFRFTLPLAGAAREDGAAQGAAGGLACPSTAARTGAGAGARAGPAPAATGPA
jgi:signal transduction histidine kinase